MRYLNWINLLLLSLIIVVGALIILSHVDAFFTVLPSEKHLTGASGLTEPVEVIARNQDFNIIVERNFFQVETGYAEYESDVEPQDIDQEFMDYKVANIGLTLLGTIFVKSAKSKAVIKDESSKAEDYYTQGESVNGYKIVGIKRKKVYLQKNEGKYLLIQAKGLGDTEAPGSGEDDLHVVSRSEVANQMRNIQNIWRDLGFTAHVDKKRNKITGAKLTWVRDGSFFQKKLGLQKDDIIKSLDGKKIKNYQEAMALYDSLSQRDRVRLEIERDGNTIYRDFQIR